MKLSKLVLGSFVLVSACNETVPEVAVATPHHAQAPADKPKADAASGPEVFGAKPASPEALALTQVLTNPDAFAEKTVTIEGVVRKACSQKGCWMEVAPTADAMQQGCRVTFKDYGFFVPLNSKGAKVRVEGVINVTTVAKTEVEHLESEGASFAKKFDDGTAREVRIVATGVEMTGRPRG